MNKTNFIAHLMVQGANPNGDPDLDNKPRTIRNDIGMITPECIKHKIRMAAALSGNNVWVHPDNILVNSVNEACEEANKNIKNKKELRSAYLKIMTDKFWDIRCFGGVLSIGNANTYTGACLTGAISIPEVESIDPINIRNVAITKCSATKLNEKGTETGKMGSKSIIDFGIYKICGGIYPHIGAICNMTDKDVKIFFESLKNAFMVDVSAARPAGSMTLIDLHKFEHDNMLGNELDRVIFESVTYSKKSGIENPTSLNDYELKTSVSIIQDKGIKYTVEKYI